MLSNELVNVVDLRFCSRNRPVIFFYVDVNFILHSILC